MPEGPTSPDDEKTEIRLSLEGGGYPCLEVLSGPRTSGRFPLKEGENFIGRSHESDILLDDSSVSRRHAVVEVGLDGVTIRDLGSRNGTKVAGQKIQQAVSLPHNRRIKVGVYELRFLTGPASSISEEEGRAEEGGMEGSDAVREENDAASGEIPLTDISIEDKGDRKKLKPKWILYAGLGGALVLTLALGLPSLIKKFFPVEPIPKSSEKPGRVGPALPAQKGTETPSALQPFFLDFAATPIPAEVFFGDQKVGVTPFRLSTNLKMGRWYEVRALFQLPEVGEVIEDKARWTPFEGTSVIPVRFSGRIGVFKIAALPRNAQLYLEGYFEKDPYRAKPIKFSEIVFGKPIYTPFGHYILELRQSRQIESSQTFIDEVVYRREFNLKAEQTDYTVQVTDEDLKTFPVEITSIPPEAKVLIDQKEVGKTPYQGTFPVGEHILTLKREGYFDFVQSIKMETNMPYVAEIPLKTSEAGALINTADALIKENRYAEALPILVEAFVKAPSPRETAQISYLVGVCYLYQKAYPQANDYFLKAMAHDDFKYAGRLGLASLAFEQGDASKALQILVEVLVSSEDPKVRADGGALFQKISPLKSVLYVTSDPPDARLFVNGVEVAQKTPLILHELGVGAYRIEFRKDGYRPTEIKLNLGVSEFRPVVAKLNKTGAP